MRIGVPKETAEGERRVALVPDVVASLKRNEKLDVVVEPGAGEEAGHPDEQYREAGAEVGGDAWGAEVVLRVAVPSTRGDRPPALRPGADRAPGATDLGGDQRRARGGGRDQLRDGGDPAHHARAGDGRALLAGRRRRLRRDPDRGAGVRSLLRHDDHGGRHRAAGEGPRARRRGGRAAGDRDGEAARRDRHRLRHPARRLGADRLARRAPAGARLHPGRRGRGRLRAPAHRRGERAGPRGARPRTPPSRT